MMSTAALLSLSPLKYTTMALSVTRLAFIDQYIFCCKCRRFGSFAAVANHQYRHRGNCCRASSRQVHGLRSERHWWVTASLGMKEPSNSLPIDLSPSLFQKLGSLDQGVLSVQWQYLWKCSDIIYRSYIRRRWGYLDEENFRCKSGFEVKPS